jgi:ribosomal-protein-alanine N-acetyltransferase
MNVLLFGATGMIELPMLDLPLRTRRLIARDFDRSDFDAIHAYASDPEVTRFMFYGPRTPAESGEYLDRMLAAQRHRPRTIWELAVIDAADNRLVGACDLTLEQPREADLGFIFARDVWGRGYASEIARALVKAGFEQLGVERIFATCDVANHASARVLEHAGLRREARLDNHKLAKNAWWTSFLYSLRREDWLAGRMQYVEASGGDVARMAHCRLADPSAGAADPRMRAYLEGRHHPQHALAPRVAFVAVAGDAVAGYIAGHLTRRYGCDGELQYLFVAPAHRRTGIASALLERLRCWFRERGASSLCVDVVPENAVARAFYTRHGATGLNEGWMVFREVR